MWFSIPVEGYRDGSSDNRLLTVSATVTVMLHLGAAAALSLGVSDRISLAVAPAFTMVQLPPARSSELPPVQPVPEPEPEIMSAAAADEVVALAVREDHTEEIRIDQPEPLPVTVRESIDPVRDDAESAPEENRQDTPSDAVSEAIAGDHETVENTEKYVEPNGHAGYLRNPEPDYPRAARLRRLEGLVILQVLVSSHGVPEKVSVRESSGHAILDDAARWAVQAWRFEPATRGGQPVDALVDVPIRFALK